VRGDFGQVEEVVGFGHGEAEHVGDGFAVVLVLEHFVFEALAAADVAGGFGVVEEAEVLGEEAGAFAVVAGAFGVEAEEAGVGFVGFGKGFADGVEDAGVGGGVGAAGLADGGLVDHDGVRVLLEKHLVDERALARAGHAGDDGEDAGGDVDGDVLQVVGVGVGDGEFALGRAEFGLDGGNVFEVLAGDGFGL
jgi:hypothetical protein